MAETLTKAQRGFLCTLSAAHRAAERRGDPGYFVGCDSGSQLAMARRLADRGLATAGKVSTIFSITPAGLAALSSL